MLPKLRWEVLVEHIEGFLLVCRSCELGENSRRYRTICVGAHEIDSVFETHFGIVIHGIKCNGGDDMATL